MNQKKMLILIVDDDEDLSAALGQRLEQSGYRAHSVSDSAHAREWLATNRPRAILLDIMMPDGNGLDLCRWIRSQKDLEKIPIIINSGVKDDETIECTLRLGAMTFLRKPVEPNEIIKTIQDWINKLDTLKKSPDF